MDFPDNTEKLDAIAPGVVEAYRALTDSDDRGIMTSLGRYYNHTIFGRDCSMGAKFMSDFDHDTVWHTIKTLASLQGMRHNHKTHEEVGRIHHEYRDYQHWKARFMDRFGLRFAGLLWGASDRVLLTYYAADTTANYIRLIHKYAFYIDRSVLDRKVICKDGSTTTVRRTVELAAEWIAAQVSEEGLFMTTRPNRWSLPYQTFADSVTAYAWQDGKPGDVSRAHSYVEAHVYALDALEDAVRLLPLSSYADEWKALSETMRGALFGRFWQPERREFAPALFARSSTLMPLDGSMITSGWTLNASFWAQGGTKLYREQLIAIVERLFADDFLTHVGLRTKSMYTKQPLGTVLDYHGSQTVWPMFNFMIIEGLRRHKLYRLAAELEHRVLNGVNAVGSFQEFFIIDHEGVLYRPSKSASRHMSGQMIPEQNIAFTVVPTLVMAYRDLYERPTEPTDAWRSELEERILARIPHVELLDAAVAAEQLAPTPLAIKRIGAGFRSAFHILPLMARKTRL